VLCDFPKIFLKFRIYRCHPVDPGGQLIADPPVSQHWFLAFFLRGRATHVVNLNSTKKAAGRANNLTTHLIIYIFK
jgi:hypothetical protein